MKWPYRDELVTTVRHRCVECGGTGLVECGVDLVECDLCHGTGEDPDVAELE